MYIKAGVEHTMAAQLRYPDDVIVTCASSAAGSGINRATVIGTEGMLEVAHLILIKQFHYSDIKHVLLPM